MNQITSNVESTAVVPGSGIGPSGPDRRRAFWLALIPLILVGCANELADVTPYSKSARASLVLNVKIPAVTAPAAAGPGRSQSAVAAPIPAVVRTLALEIGNPGDADFLEPPPFDIVVGSGQIQDLTVANVAPGANRRVAFFGRDAGGVTVVSGVFRINFVPGAVASNDITLGGGATQDEFFLATDPPPLPPGNFLVTEKAGNRLVQVDINTGVRTVRFDFGPTPVGPHGVARDVFGRVLVTESLGGRLVRIDLNTGVRTVLTSGLNDPRGVVEDGDAERSIVIAERGAGRLLRISASTGAIIDVIQDIGVPGLEGIGFFSSGFFPLTDSGAGGFILFEGGGLGTYFDYAVRSVTPNPSPEFIAVAADDSLIVSETSPAQLVKIGLVPPPPAVPDELMNTRTPFFSFPGGTLPGGIITESPTSFVVAERGVGVDAIVRITDLGMRTPLVTMFPMGSAPTGIAR